MPVAEKEFVLNYAMNRWQLNFKKNVGPTSDSVRQCNPRTKEEWRNYYYKNIRSSEHIDNLGRQLFDRIKNTLPEERRFHQDLIDSVTLDDCIAYMHIMVTDRVFNGYMKEHGK